MGPGGTGLRRVRTTAATAAATAAALLLSSCLLAGCSEGVDLAHSVQTRLGRVDGVLSADVTAPSDAEAPRIELTVDPDLTAADLVLLLRAVGKVTVRDDYPSHRLELEPADEEGDVLVVDDTFAGRDDELAVLESWQAVTQALLGPVTYTVEDGTETIAVASDGGLLHDATEASRIGYGGAGTTWRFTSGPSAVLVTGRVAHADVEMLQRVQRSTVSSELPVAATSWRLERRRDHVLLALEVGLPEQVEPARLTTERYAEDLRPLARAALAAVGVGDAPRAPDARPVWLQLRHDTPAGDDVFGFWVSDHRPVHGRDRLDRHWDRWLVALAGAAG
ncbi:hypothetical protein H5V45_12010 [Nocardioides sp. KIGAM211]|uniref:Uncharacterized protein n=1 Tax=Nocardioides luti TaxID=2761101 RepID=A0A7X0RJ76_9ACTN|nr:hypothetical protein [Nocardioides luti]MBB6628043.1 hypothetical protein [Nocardioides luti]